MTPGLLGSAKKLVPPGAPRLVAGRRRAVEREFLPAALEIMETPASPAGRATALTIAAAAVLAVVWACVGKVDIIATASGRIIPVGMSKTVQPLEAGVVTAIRVREGDHVSAGESLIELDPTLAQADRDRAARDLLQAKLDQARLAGLRASWHTNAGPKLIGVPANASVAQREQAIASMRAEFDAQAAKLAGLDQQIAQKQGDATAAAATIAKLQASLPWSEQEAALRQKLLAVEFGNQLAWMEAERNLTEQQHDVAVYQAQQVSAQAAQAALIRQREQAVADEQKTVLDDLAKAQDQISQARQALTKAKEQISLQTLRAPIDGTVQQLAVHTLGGVVSPAQAVLVVVPDDPRIEVRARLANADVGFVHPGQTVAVKVEAFTFTRYGLVPGTVVGISHDAVDEPRPSSRQGNAGNPPHTSANDGKDAQDSGPGYTVQIALGQSSIRTENGVANFEPGMAVTAEIKTGQRRVISYLLSPLTRYRQEGLRER